jgi:hypothetical protein
MDVCFVELEAFTAEVSRLRAAVETIKAKYNR